jgi:hypothetical protein
MYDGEPFTAFERLLDAGFVDFARMIYEVSPRVIHFNRGTPLIRMLDSENPAVVNFATEVIQTEVSNASDASRRSNLLGRRPDPRARNGEASLLESLVIRGLMDLFRDVLYHIYLGSVQESEQREDLASWLDYAIQLGSSAAINRIRGLTPYFRAMVPYTAAELVSFLVRAGFMESASVFANTTRENQELEERSLISLLVDGFQWLIDSEHIDRLNDLFVAVPRLVVSNQGRNNLRQGLINNVLMETLNRSINPHRRSPEDFSIILIEQLRPYMDDEQLFRAREAANRSGQQLAAERLTAGEEEEAALLPLAKKRRR